MPDGSRFDATLRRPAVSEDFGGGMGVANFTMISIDTELKAVAQKGLPPERATSEVASVLSNAAAAVIENAEAFNSLITALHGEAKTALLAVTKSSDGLGKELKKQDAQAGRHPASHPPSSKADAARSGKIVSAMDTDAQTIARISAELEDESTKFDKAHGQTSGAWRQVAERVLGPRNGAEAIAGLVQAIKLSQASQTLSKKITANIKAMDDKANKLAKSARQDVKDGARKRTQDAGARREKQKDEAGKVADKLVKNCKDVAAKLKKGTGLAHDVLKLCAAKAPTPPMAKDCEKKMGAAESILAEANADIKKLSAQQGRFLLVLAARYSEYMSAGKQSGAAIDDLTADGAAYAKLIKTCRDGAKAMARQIHKARP